MNKMKITISTKRGFTLIELLVVISIIGMLSSVVMAGMQTAREKGVIGSAQSFESHTHHAFGADAVVSFDFNEGAGTVAVDGSGNNNNITGLTPATLWTSGIFDDAIDTELANSPGIVVAKNIKSFTNLNTLGSGGTVSMWIFPRASTGLQTLAHYFNSNGGINIPTNKGLKISYADDGFISVRTSLGTSWVYVKRSNAIPQIDKWSHVLVTWSNQKDTVDIYINGKLSNGASESGRSVFSEGLIPTGEISVYVGTRANNSGGFTLNGEIFKGKIDNFRIYSKSIQTAEVEKIFAEESPKYGIAGI